LITQRIPDHNVSDLEHWFTHTDSSREPDGPKPLYKKIKWFYVKRLNYFFWTLAGAEKLWLTHTDPTVIINTFYASRNKTSSTKNNRFGREAECTKDSASLYTIKS
jgi:hypothetical protein